MKRSRRDLLKGLAGTAAAGAGLAGCTRPLRVARKKPPGRSTTICPYCAVGCGMLLSTKGGRVVHVEGDPEHPISEGTLCSKGGSLVGTLNSPERVTAPMYRAPKAKAFKRVTWDWAIDRIARRIKETRDRTWIERDERGRTVRRTEAIAHVGSAALDNEECILLVKALRAMGLVYIEHQARI